MHALAPIHSTCEGFPDGSVVKNLPVGDTGLVFGSGRFPGEGNGSSLQYFYLGNFMDKGVWGLQFSGWQKSWTWLSGAVQFSRSVVSDSLRPHGLQHARLPCPSPTPGACSNSCSSSQWCHPTTLSSAVPFSSCLKPFPASGSFPKSQFFASGGQSIGVSAPVLPMNIQDCFPLGLTGLISLKSKGLSRVFSNTTVQKHQFFDTQLSLWSNSHIHTGLLEKWFEYLLLLLLSRFSRFRLCATP